MNAKLEGASNSCALSLKDLKLQKIRKCHTIRPVSHRHGLLVKASSNFFVPVPAAVESLKDKLRTLDVSINRLAELPGYLADFEH